MSTTDLSSLATFDFEWQQIYKESLDDELQKVKAGIEFDNNFPCIFIIMGASGELSTTKVYPALWSLYKCGLLPKSMVLYGFGRTHMDVSLLRDISKPYMVLDHEKDARSFEKFWSINNYFQGNYYIEEDFVELNKILVKHHSTIGANRIFYLALPYSVVPPCTANIKSSCMATGGWTRIIIEKPFGRSLETANSLNTHLCSLFKETEIYRMDHYLGKEIVQSLLALRFTNSIFLPLWNRQHIDSVQIKFKSTDMVRGRPGAYEEVGVLRDMVVSNVMQVMSLVAMERPVSCKIHDIRAAKVSVLKYIKPIEPRWIVTGQYFEYSNDPSVPSASVTPTYAMLILTIDNERWQDVPWLITCGKALDERCMEVRIKFKKAAVTIFSNEEDVERNELVISIHPEEELYLKFNVKKPGVGFDVEPTRLDLKYSKRYSHMKMPGAYERLIQDIICGHQMNFVSTEELAESWRIFTPIIYFFERSQMQPYPYEAGTSGPSESARLMDLIT